MMNKTCIMTIIQSKPSYHEKHELYNHIQNHTIISRLILQFIQYSPNAGMRFFDPRGHSLGNIRSGLIFIGGGGGGGTINCGWDSSSGSGSLNSRIL